MKLASGSSGLPLLKGSIRHSTYLTSQAIKKRATMPNPQDPTLSSSGLTSVSTTSITKAGKTLAAGTPQTARSRMRRPHLPARAVSLCQLTMKGVYRSIGLMQRQRGLQEAISTMHMDSERDRGILGVRLTKEVRANLQN